jgi:hypothetical protein
MAKIGSYRSFLLGIGAVVLLTGAAVTMCWRIRSPSTTASVDPSPPPQGEPPALVQLEAPSEEVDLNGGHNFAEEGDESGWVDSGDPASIPLLIRYLKSQDELVQLAALDEFAGMGAKAKKAAAAVVQALQDPKSSIRVEAAVTLIHMNVQAKAAVKALAKELRSEDAESRARAAGAIDKLVNPPLEDLGISCWGPNPPPRIARPWVTKAVEQDIR